MFTSPFSLGIVLVADDSICSTFTTNGTALVARKVEKGGRQTFFRSCLRANVSAHGDLQQHSRRSLKLFAAVKVSICYSVKQDKL